MSWLSSGQGWQQLNPKRRAIQARLTRDPFARLRSLQEVAIAAECGIKIDVNQATVDDWLRLPGLSIHQARSLVELTQMGVQFLSLEDLAAALGLSPQVLQPFTPILAFNYYDPESTFSPRKINLNTANLEQLKQIPCLNPQICQTILQNRQQQGPYRNLPHFQQRLNLDSDLISQLMHYLRW
ncbi:MAG: ComEA family DNA-binding protein [Spirulinaceae cyanobacterium]